MESLARAVNFLSGDLLAAFTLAFAFAADPVEDFAAVLAADFALVLAAGFAAALRLLVAGFADFDALVSDDDFLLEDFVAFLAGDFAALVAAAPLFLLIRASMAAHVTDIQSERLPFPVTAYAGGGHLLTGVQVQVKPPHRLWLILTKDQ